jgi:tRNA (Thr-GGU) A37 N-methylase
MKFEIQQVGTIHSPYKNKEDCPIQGCVRQLTNNNSPIFPYLIYKLIFHQMTTSKNTGVSYAKIWAKS